MKVVYIFRARTPIFHSIERVFDIMIRSLPVNLIHYNIRVREYGFSFKNLIYVFKQIKTLDKDTIFHLTGDIHYAVAIIPRRRTILTIHDLVFLQQYKGTKRWLIKWLYLDMPVKRSAIITTISEKSRQEIIKYTKCNIDKIVVVPNPVSHTLSYIEKVFNKEKPIILFIGSTPNKNLERVIVALKHIPCSLRIIGKISAQQRKLLIDNAINFSNVSGISEQELNEEYCQTDMVIFPSLYEGFGLPIIEAQKTGRVVITSNLAPMDDVAGGSACLVDPYSIDSIRECILKVIHDDVYRNDLIQKGFKNVKRFLPEEIANQYLDLYKKIASKKL